MEEALELAKMAYQADEYKVNVQDYLHPSEEIVTEIETDLATTSLI